MNSRMRTGQRLVQRVWQLTGKLLHKHIQDTEWQELQSLITSSVEARRAYVESMLLRAELYRADTTIEQEQHT
jgi:hypothetical protein